MSGAEAIRLPRGRHGMPREEVVANQRRRLLAATANLFAGRGYPDFSVGDVIAGAQVSRATFYKLFDDKADCVLATHRAASERLEDEILTACLSRSTWPQGVAAAISAALTLAAEEPAEASLIVFAPLAGEAALTRQARTVNSRLLTMLRAGRESCPEAVAPGELVERASLLGTINLVGMELLDGRARDLPRLVSEITRIMLAPYIGPDEAARLVA